MAHGENGLSPVGFGAGEPNLRPIYEACKSVGSYASTTTVINLVIVAVSNFFSYSFVSPLTAGFTGLMTAISYPLAKKVIERLPVHQKKLPYHEIKEKALLVISVLVSSFIFSQFLGEARLLPSLAMSAFDITWMYYLVDMTKVVPMRK